MKIGIIVAMQREMDLLLEVLDSVEQARDASGLVYMGSLHGHSVMLRKCGIGKVNAAVGAVDLINAFSPDVVINTGVAGGTGSAAHVLDVVLASGIGYHDTWCGPGTSRGGIQGLPDVFTPVHDVELLAGKIGVKTGMVASGDIFVSEPEDFKRVMAIRPNAAAIDMESGAIAQVCYLRGVPFLCLRVISDTPGTGENAAQYEQFWTSAPQRVFEKLKSLIEVL